MILPCKKKNAKYWGGLSVYLLFEKLDSHMKQKIVWCIRFVNCFSILHQWNKKKIFSIKMKVENISNTLLRSKKKKIQNTHAKVGS